MAVTRMKFESFDDGVKTDAQKALANYVSHHGMTLSGKLAEMVERLLRMGLESGGVAIAPIARDISPEQAGKILGVSRPLIVQRMDDGRLPFHFVGSHRRCSLRDVLKLKEAEDPVNEALAQLYEEHEALENGPSL